MQDVLGIDIARVTVVPSPGYPAAGHLGRPGAVAVVQHPVPDLVRDLVLEPGRVVLQRGIQVDLVGRVEERAHEDLEGAVGLALVAKRRIVEPRNFETEFPGDIKDVVDVHREVLLADALGQVEEPVVDRKQAGALKGDEQVVTHGKAHVQAPQAAPGE